MLIYETFYRQYGIRRTDQMQSPPLPPVSMLKLPQGSIFHYVGNNSSLDQGPPSDDLMFADISKSIFMQHIVKAGDTLGNPKPISELPDAFIRPYHIRNRRFKRMLDLTQSQKDQHNLIVYNYAYIPRLYNYQRSLYTEYNRWHNTQAALWKNIAGLMPENDRQHYLRITLPRTLPSVSNLELGEKGMTQATAKIFSTPESLMILELWKWLNPDTRTQSVLNHLPAKHFDRINLIVMESGRWIVINLGKLESWRAPSRSELKADPKLTQKGVNADRLQRLFLRLLMVVFETRTVAPPAFVTEEIASANGNGTEKAVVKDVVLNRKTGKVELKDPGDGEATFAVSEAPDDTADTVKFDAKQIEKLDAELAELETISEKVNGTVDATGNLVKAAAVEEPLTLEQGVIRVAERHAENGTISAAELLRFTKAASTYKTLLAVDGKTTLDKFIEIPAEMLEIKESKAIPDIKTVVDKTMLKSSLHQFDSRYVKDVIHRDVAGMVLGVQNAGLAITDFQSELVESITGSYRDYTIKVLPVEGAPTTWRFKVPELKPDGSYQSNNVNYRLRKQRGD